jgi:hypothetical protein
VLWFIGVGAGLWCIFRKDEEDQEPTPPWALWGGLALLIGLIVALILGDTFSTNSLRIVTQMSSDAGFKILPDLIKKMMIFKS